MSRLNNLTTLIEDYEAQLAEHEAKIAEYEAKAKIARDNVANLKRMLYREETVLEPEDLDRIHNTPPPEDPAPPPSPPPEPEPEPVSTRSKPVPTRLDQALEGGYCKLVDGKYVCLNCKQGGGPRVRGKGYANYGAWYNHCYGHRNGYETNCSFDA